MAESKWQIASSLFAQNSLTSLLPDLKLKDSSAPAKLNHDKCPMIRDVDTHRVQFRLNLNQFLSECAVWLVGALRDSWPSASSQLSA